MCRVSSLLLFLALGALPFSAYGQPDLTGAYQRTITISHNNVAGSDQTDFPVLISGTYPFLANVQNGGNVQNSNGYDILFSSDPAAQQLLDFEIDTYDPTTGAVNFWVRIPTLSQTSDTTIYLTYGISGVTTSYENKLGVWKNNYLSVYHFGSGTTLNATDSGSAAYDLSGSATLVPGQIGGGVSFSGDPTVFLYHDSVDSYPSGQSQVTLEAWSSMLNTNGELLGYGENSADGSRAGLGSNGSNFIFEFENMGTSSLQPQDSKWHHYAAVYGGGAVTSSNPLIYIDGGLSTLYPGYGTPNILNTQLKIGGIPTVTFCCAFVGSLDEVRISAGTRSADWIATEYANQSAPSSFYTVQLL